MLINESFFDEIDDTIYNEEISEIEKHYNYRLQLTTSQYGSHKPNQDESECNICMKKISYLFLCDPVISDFNTDTYYSVEFNINNNISPKSIRRFSNKLIKILTYYNFNCIALFSKQYKDGLKFFTDSKNWNNEISFFNLFGMMDDYIHILSYTEKQQLIEHIINNDPNPNEYSECKLAMVRNKKDYHKYIFASLFHYNYNMLQMKGRLILDDENELEKLINKTKNSLKIIKKYKYNGDTTIKTQFIRTYYTMLLSTSDETGTYYGLLVEETIE